MDEADADWASENLFMSKESLRPVLGLERAENRIEEFAPSEEVRARAEVIIMVALDEYAKALYREMVDRGAKFFLVTSGWPYPRLEAWNVLNQARALENTCCLVSSNAAGIQNKVRFLGHSQIVDPWGTVVAGSGYLETIVKAEIDDDLVDQVRAEFPVLKDRVLLNKT